MFASCGCHVAFQVVLRAFWDSKWLLVPCVAFRACCWYPVISKGCLGAVFKGCSWGRFGALPEYSPGVFARGILSGVLGVSGASWGLLEASLDSLHHSGISWGSPGVLLGRSWGFPGGLFGIIEVPGGPGGFLAAAAFWWGGSGAFSGAFSGAVAHFVAHLVA